MDLPAIPVSVLLGACRYVVQETADRMILFRTESGMPGFEDVFMFTRQRDGKSDGYWKVAVTPGHTDGSFDPAHLAQAHEMVKVWRGDDWKPYWPRERYNPRTGRTPAQDAEQMHGLKMALARHRAGLL